MPHTLLVLHWCGTGTDDNRTGHTRMFVSEINIGSVQDENITNHPSYVVLNIMYVEQLIRRPYCI
jgi:hypothetical protein